MDLDFAYSAYLWIDSKMLFGLSLLEWTFSTDMTKLSNLSVISGLNVCFYTFSLLDKFYSFILENHFHKYDCYHRNIVII